MALRVVHLAASVGTGGAAIALLNLHKGLCQIGVGSSILAGNGHTAGAQNVRIIGNPFNRLNQMVYGEVICRNRTPLSNTPFSFDAGGIFVNCEREVLEADLIQLHWVANFLNTSSLSALASLGKPVLWTLHDMRPFTGGCHYSAGCEHFQQGCESCPQLQSALHNFPARAHMGQTEAVRLLQPVFVSPSRWLANECLSSSVARSCRVEVIPYGIDAKVFAPIDQKDARRCLGLDAEALYIMLGAHSLGEQRKGGLSAQQALRELARQASSAEFVSTGQWRVVSCGEEAFPLDAPWHTEHLGYLSEQDMTTLYAACDVLLLPSQEDNFPNMLLEAMACGLPVVAYRVGGVPELVEDGKTGLLADPFDTSSLCAHLKTILRTAELRQSMARTARTLVTSSFTLDAQARLYHDLYARLIARKSKVPGPAKVINASNADSFDLALDALAAAMTERAREKSDAHSELSRLRRWNHYLRRQSLVEFVSRNIRVRCRLVRRSKFLRKKPRHVGSWLGKLLFKMTHFRGKR